MRVSEILGDSVCPTCRTAGGDKTGNHLILFSDGGAYCNRCEYQEPPETFTEPRVGFGEKKTEEELKQEVENVNNETAICEISDRKIKLTVSERFGVRTSLSEVDGRSPTAWYFPSFKDGELQGFRIRYAKGKYFNKAGRTKKGEFFGINRVPPQGNKLFVTEGEFDAMALYQIMYDMAKPEWRDRVSVVSLCSGAQGAKGEFLRNKELIEGYKEIILCFDQDKAGQAATKEVIKAIPEKTVYVAKFSEKDACDMLKEGKGRELYFACITASSKVRPEKILSGSEVSIDDLLVPLKKGLEVPYPMLMEKMHGFRYGDGGGELTVVCAGSGMGKTTLAREIMFHLNSTHEMRLGHIFLEEQSKKTIQSYIAIDNNVPLGILRENPTSINFKNFKKSYDRLIDNERMFYLSHFGSLASKDLMGYMRHFSMREGCDFIGLDHISMVISGQEAGRGGERKDIDMLMTNLAAFCEDTGTSVIAIVHLNRPDGGCFNDGKKITLANLRGSAAIEQLSHNIIAVEGDQGGDCPNIRHVRVLKNREWGDVGLADSLEYHPNTGRLLPLDVSFGGNF